MRNRKKTIKTTSKYKGVCWSKRDKRWAAFIKAENKKTKFLGNYKNEIDAASAYNNAAIIFYKEFANLNII